MKKNRVLVTGGAGFLGSHLSKKLLESGKTVICVDNFFTGREENLLGLLKYSNFQVIRHDISSYLDIEVDEIYNLACPASPIHYQSDPIGTIKTCVQGSINLLELAKKTKAKIFQASTSEIYGDPQIHPQVESYWGHVNPIGLRSCYDEGKRCAETLFFDYFRLYEVDIKLARIFNTYGPRMHAADGRVVSNFIVQALKNEPLTIYGDGKQSRSFCYVDDLIDGILSFMDLNASFPGPLNLGNPQEFEIQELAKIILNLTASQSTIVYRKLPSDDPRQRKPDITFARERFGWEPRVSLHEGLLRTIEYFKEELEVSLLH